MRGKGRGLDRIIDKTLIFLLCMTMVTESQKGELMIGGMLLATIITSLFVIIDNKNYKTVIGIVAGILLVIKPEMRCFLPLFAYDIVGNRDKVNNVIFFLCAVMAFIRGEMIANLVLFIFMIIALWMNRQSEQKNNVERKIIENRDTSFELTEALKKKNKMLIEKQEYEVYAATLGERNRIAREIHDNVGHMLSRSILQVGALMAIHKEEKVHEELSAVRDTLDSAMNSIRESVHDLHNASIDLEASIKEAISGMKGYDIKFSYGVDSHMDDKIKHCFLATVKEGLANVYKHSNGDKVWININEHPAFYQCIVKDNGTKHKATAKGMSSPGIGLENIQSRVDSLGGNLLITNEDGYRLFIMIPKK